MRWMPLVVLTLLLSGCRTKVTQQEQIVLTEACHKAGGTTEEARYEWDGQLARVDCRLDKPWKGK